MSDYNEGYDDGYDEGYEEGLEDGKQQSEVYIDEALKVVMCDKGYHVFPTKTVEDQMKAELLRTAFEKMSLVELEKVFSRHQRKLFGYTLIV